MTTQIFAQTPISEIYADTSFNCRGAIDPMSVLSLAQDIKARGLTEPVILMPLKDATDKPGKKYLLIAGYRRYTAHLVNNAATISSLIRSDIPNMAEAQYLNLSENLHRQDLDIVQECEAVKKLRDLGQNRHEIAEHLSKSPGWVQARTMMIPFPQDIKEQFRSGILKQKDIAAVYSLLESDETPEKSHFRVELRKLLDDRLAGKKTELRDTAIRKDVKRIRKKAEMLELMEHCYETVGNGLHTRILAWAGGEITDEVLETAMKEYCTEHGLTWKPMKRDSLI